jgi:hypothetical protein
VFTSQEGSLGEVSEFFEVMAQVDRDLTTVEYFDQLLGLIKNLGRHILITNFNIELLEKKDPMNQPWFSILLSIE